MRFLLATLLLLSPACSSAPHTASPEDERAVVDTVQAFFDAIGAGDAEAGARLTVPEGVFVSIRGEEGGPVLRHFSNAEWVAGLSADGPPMKEVFDGEPTVFVDGDVAMVWAPYVFYRDGALSHTGVDVFNLLRTEDGWKIAGGVYSVVR